MLRIFNSNPFRPSPQVASCTLIVSPFNWRLAAAELAWQVDDSDPKVIVADDAHAIMAERIAGQRPVMAARALLDVALTVDHPGPQPADSDLLLVYSSGATGRPKGALLTQGAVMANAQLAWDMHGMTADDHVLTALPMFHVGGLNIQTLPALLKGARVTLMERFAPGPCLELIQRLRPSLTVQVPATMQAMMAEDAWRETDLSSLRAISTGSTDVPTEMIKHVHDRGVPVIQIYGATETGPVVIYQHIAEAKSQLGSIGRPGHGVQARLVADGSDVPPGAQGEIWLKSPTLARGYWNNPDADEAFVEGWFRTGDIARCDTEGFYWFTDRSKNVIISGGENIYPAELERVLRAVPGVEEAAVAGCADQRWGAVPIAVIVGDADDDAIQTAFEGTLARYKHPKGLMRVAALPRNAMGKVDTIALSAIVAEYIS